MVIGANLLHCGRERFLLEKMLLDEKIAAQQYVAFSRSSKGRNGRQNPLRDPQGRIIGVIGCSARALFVRVEEAEG